MKIVSKVSVLAFAVSFFIGLSGPTALLAAGPASVNLGSAGNFTILAKTGISTTGITSIVGDIGVSPAAATYITGFALALPVASAFSTSALVTGKVYAPGYADPTPSNITTAVSDMQTAYTDAMGRTNPTATELGAGNIGGMTLAPGLYKWGTGVTIPTDVTLSGGANDIWIFQIAQNLDVSSAARVVLTGGAQAGNIFWVVAGQTTLGTTAVFNGNILDQTAIVLNTGAVLNGRALAQSQVTLDANTVLFPTLTVVTPAVPATPATPAVPTVSPAVPATPATPVTTQTTTTVADTGCVSGNKFSTVSGRNCVAVTTTIDIADAGCLSGNKFSITTGRNCESQAGVSSNAASSDNFGQQVRMIAISLGQGSRGSHVTTLQQFLISQNKGPAAQALSAHGTTQNFGSLTRAALAEFQASVGIVPALGNFGAITRAYISSH